MTNMDDTWVAVADGGKARFFSTDASLEILTELDGLANKHHGGDHRKHGGVGHDATEGKFAEEIADHLTAAAARRQYRDLVIVAPPHMLGDLRDALPATVASHVTATLARDLVAVEKHELSTRLRKLLADRHIEHAH